MPLYRVSIEAEIYVDVADEHSAQSAARDALWKEPDACGVRYDPHEITHREHVPPDWFDAVPFRAPGDDSPDDWRTVAERVVALPEFTPPVCCCQQYRDRGVAHVSNCCPVHNDNPDPPAPGCRCARPAEAYRTWILVRTPAPKPGRILGTVVAARNEDEARRLASEYHSDPRWLDDGFASATLQADEYHAGGFVLDTVKQPGDRPK